MPRRYNNTDTEQVTDITNVVKGKSQSETIAIILCFIFLILVALAAYFKPKPGGANGIHSGSDNYRPDRDGPAENAGKTAQTAK